LYCRFAIGGWRIGNNWVGFFQRSCRGELSARFHLGRRRADREWSAARYPRLKDAGTVKQFTILPLIDWYTAREDLMGEPGISYLLQAGDTNILFDVGLNGHGEHPSPLLRNMQALGVSLEEIDAIVISHLDPDHVGGMACQQRQTFALSGKPGDLHGLKAYVPAPMTHLTAQVEVVTGPRVIAPGIVSLDPIPRQMFSFGCMPEQSLAVNVAGKGIVLVIGRGHSTIQRIIDRAEMLFDAALYGVIGGLHYPVTASREVMFGLPMQRILGKDKWPWDPINRDDVQAAITYLHHRRPQLVALSPHDSCDWSLEAFRQAFGEAYREVLVGQEIVVQ
jgi:7,8-dihydropterin-6-yl-methyl-4-(beta-D-ribofuranosyl)aminobenzene 5'-phosphate synthase